MFKKLRVSRQEGEKKRREASEEKVEEEEEWGWGLGASRKEVPTGSVVPLPGTPVAGLGQELRETGLCWDFLDVTVFSRHGLRAGVIPQCDDSAAQGYSETCPGSHSGVERAGAGFESGFESRFQGVAPVTAPWPSRRVPCGGRGADCTAPSSLAHKGVGFLQLQSRQRALSPASPASLVSR